MLKIKTIVTNAFSINMLPPHYVKLIFRPLDLSEAREFLLPDFSGNAPAWESAVGHEDTAAVFSTLLQQEIAYNRASIQIAPGVRLLVGQYTGPRLPEGATTLPEGAAIAWWLVSV